MCSFFVLVLLAFIIRHGAKDGTPKNIQEAKTTIAKWDRLSFVPIGDTNRLDHYIRYAEIKDENNLLNDQKKQALHNSLKLMLYAYNRGEYEDFIKFRLPEGVPYIKNEREWQRITSYWYQDHPDAVRKDLPTDSELYRWWIERDQIGNGVYQNYWQGITLSSNEVYSVLGDGPYKGKKAKLGIYITEMPEWKLGSPLTETYNVGINIVKNSFLFQFHDPNDIGKYANDPLLSAQVYFFIKTISSDNVIPIYAKFIWNAKFEQWLPVSLIRGDLLPLYQSLYFTRTSRVFKF